MTRQSLRQVQLDEDNWWNAMVEKVHFIVCGEISGFFKNPLVNLHGSAVPSNYILQEKHQVNYL